MPPRPHSGPGTGPSPSYLQGPFRERIETPTAATATTTPTTIKSEKRPATKTPPPTSPHELDQIAIFDFVAEVADIHPVLPLAVFGELDRFFVRRIYWPT